MAEIRTRRSVLAAHTETVTGTANGALVAGDADCLPMNLSFAPEFSSFDRKLYDASISSFQHIIGTQKGVVTFKVELKGSGTVAIAPKLGKFLIACGMKETTVAATSVTYTPDSASTASLTMGVYRDGLQKRMLGSRGTFKLAAKAGEPIMLDFTFNGVYDAVSDTTLLVPTGTETTIPFPLLSAGMTIFSFAAHAADLSLDLNNTLAMREDINNASGYIGCVITSRDSKGSLSPEEELVATKDWYGIWKGNTPGNFGFTMGATGGNICAVSCPAVAITKVAEQDRNGLAALAVDFQVARTAGSVGNNEISLAFT